MLDNIAALEALANDSASTDAYLVPPPRARLLSIYTPQAWFGAGQFFAENPDSGATIDYFLRDAGDTAQIAVTDAANRVVRTLKGPARRGLNRLVWDLRLEPPLGEADRGSPSPGGGVPQGPAVLPGMYNIALRVPGSGRELKTTLRVEGDPRVNFSDADRRARQTALMKLYELQRTLGGARASARAAAGQIEAQRKEARPALETGTKLSQLQGDITAQVNTIATLTRAIEGYSGLPTADQHRQTGWAADDVARILTDLNRVLRTDTR